LLSELGMIIRHSIALMYHLRFWTCFDWAPEAVLLFSLLIANIQCSRVIVQQLKKGKITFF